MTGAAVTDNTGTYLPAKALYVADATGTFRAVTNAWVSQSDGTYAKFWPVGANILSFTAKAGSPNYTTVVLTWSVVNAVSIEIHIAGSGISQHDDTRLSGSYTYVGTPGSTVNFVVRAIAADGSQVDSPHLPVVFAQLPAPANFRRTGGTAFGSFYAWNAVPGADTYRIVDTLHSNAIQGSIAAPTLSFAETDLAPSTVYERAVHSILGSQSSGLSNKLRYTTPKASGPAPGTYDFPCTYAEAWAPGYAAWRGSGDGIVHGNGDNWGGSNGNNVTMFFYYLAYLQALLAGGKVTRFKIRIARDSSAGVSSPQANHFQLHTAANRPAGNPAGFLGAAVDAGSLAWGQEAAFDLPASWGQALVDGTLNTSGIAWGNVAGRYMRGPSLGAHPDQGHLYITIA